MRFVGMYIYKVLFGGEFFIFVNEMGMVNKEKINFEVREFYRCLESNYMNGSVWAVKY